MIKRSYVANSVNWFDNPVSLGLWSVNWAYCGNWSVSWARGRIFPDCWSNPFAWYSINFINNFIDVN